MKLREDYTGQKIGRLQVKGVGYRDCRGIIKWECECDCGKTVFVYGSTLKPKSPIRSCGCYTRERVAQMNYKHGGRFTKTYQVWASMRKRCNNPTHHAYHLYGGRGIKVCERWDVYENFLSDMGDAPAGYSLDRINNDEGYSKENCRWATTMEQANNRSTNVFIEWDGVKYSVQQLSTKLGVKRHNLYKWAANGDDVVAKIKLVLERNEQQ